MNHFFLVYKSTIGRHVEKHKREANIYLRHLFDTPFFRALLVSALDRFAFQFFKISAIESEKETIDQYLKSI